MPPAKSLLRPLLRRRRDKQKSLPSYLCLTDTLLLPRIPRGKTELTTAYDFAADYPFPCRNNHRRAHFEDGEWHRLHRTPWFHISDCRFFCAVYGVGFFRLVIKILRGAAFGVTELRANLLLAFTLARADGKVFFKVGYYIVALIGR